MTISTAGRSSCRTATISSTSSGAGCQERTGVYYGSLETPSLRKWIMPAYSRVAYSPTGHLLFVRNETLMAQAFDPQGAVLSAIR